MHVKNFSFWYSAQGKPILKNINLKIEKNENIAILGPNGSGKTTLAYCLCGIIPHLINGKVDGDILINGKSIRDYKIRNIIKNVGVIFQNPDTQFVTLRVKDEVAFGLENADYPEDEIESRFNYVVKKFDLLDLLDKSPQDLSMGQKQKVALASVIAMTPNVLLLDEPASTLDPRGRRLFVEAIRALRGHMTIIMLTHDWEFIRKIADRVIVIHDRTIKYDGSLDLLKSKDVMRLFGLDGNHHECLAQPSTKPVIQVEDLSFRYSRSDKLSLDNVSFEVKAGEALGVVGPNGSGKSTLFSLMQGLRKPKRGRILIDGKDIIQMDFPELIKKQGILFQNPDHQIFAPSVDEELRFGLKNAKMNEGEMKRRIETASGFLNFDDLSRDPHSLSYGQRKLLSLATVIAMNPDVYLLDEPELGLDIGFIDKFEKCLIKLNREGKTFVIVSHNLNLIKNMTHRLIFLEDGRITKEGPTKQVIGDVRDYFDR